MEPDYDSPPRRLRTVKQVVADPDYAWLSASALRHLIFNAKPRIASNGDVMPGNGLAECGAIFRVNRKLLIDLDRFGAWLGAHRVGGE